MVKHRVVTFGWNLLTRLLNVVCHGETIVMTSPSGGVRISLCDGWCKAFKVEADGCANVGFGNDRFAMVLPAYEKHLRAEGRFVAADELYRIMGAT